MIIHKEAPPKPASIMLIPIASIPEVEPFFPQHAHPIFNSQSEHGQPIKKIRSARHMFHGVPTWYDSLSMALH